MNKLELELPKSAYLNLTENGEILVGGLFTAHDTNGISIDLSYDLCKAQNVHVDWVDFLSDAGRQKDWKWDWAVAKMKEQIPEQYDEVYSKYQVLVMDLYKKLILENLNITFSEICQYIVETKQKNATKI